MATVDIMPQLNYIYWVCHLAKSVKKEQIEIDWEQEKIPYGTLLTQCLKEEGLRPG